VRTEMHTRCQGRMALDPQTESEKPSCDKEVPHMVTWIHLERNGLDRIVGAASALSFLPSLHQIHRSCGSRPLLCMLVNKV
jgi:hypothetical protein